MDTEGEERETKDKMTANVKFDEDDIAGKHDDLFEKEERLFDSEKKKHYEKETEESRLYDTRDIST